VAGNPLQDDPPLVDVHAHIFRQDAPLAASAWTRLTYDFRAEDYIRQLDAHGIHFGVISGISISGYYNDYMIEQLRRQPRLRGTAILPPTTDRYTLDRMKADGILGVRLQLTRLPLPDFGSEEWRLFLRRIADLDWHVHFALESERTPPLLELLDEAGVKIVVDHFGHPDPALGADCPGFQAILRMAEKGRTWVKLSSAFRLTRPQNGGTNDLEACREMAGRLSTTLFEHLGPERLVWGSDSPFVGHEHEVSYDDTLASFAEWAPDPKVRRRMADTALKLYFS
jgi:predicted TIM-barrel fold metal-dependent hydrolase